MCRTTIALAIGAIVLFTPARSAADVVSDWNQVMVTTVGGQNPFAQARFAAMTQLAVFEAVNAISGDYKPYLGTIAAPLGASPEAAAIAAAHRVLRTYFSASAVSLDAARASSLFVLPDGPTKSDGIAVGEAAAAALVALRANDGSGSPVPYTPSQGPGYWQPTPPAFGPAILRHWGQVTPFGILSGDQFRAEPPPALTSSRYWKDYYEVKALGNINSPDRPQDRTNVARFYAATSAVQAWNPAAIQAGSLAGPTLVENARALALLNMAINDGLISSLETKYSYPFWRPVTAIRAGDTDGNPSTAADPQFTPLIATPAFPGYPSAHASAGYAARVVLERLYGRGDHVITLSNPAVADVQLHYTGFDQITWDIDDARVYGGIHFRFDQEAGAHQGRQVGRYILENQLRPTDAGLSVSATASSYSAGQTMVLTGTLTSQSVPGPVDAYIVLQLPTGQFLSLQLGGRLVPGIVPIARGLVPFNYEGTLAQFTFTGGEPVGTYTWHTVLTEPGTLNFVGPLQRTTFTVP